MGSMAGGGREFTVFPYVAPQNSRFACPEAGEPEAEHSPAGVPPAGSIYQVYIIN